MPFASPDIRNFTRPGGIAVYFDDGAGGGYRHLGNLDIAKLSAEMKNDELEIDSQLSGESRLAETIITRRTETHKLALQEIVPENLRPFFCGGALATVNAGTAAVVNQLVQLHGELLTSVGQYGLTLVSAATLDDTPLVKNVDYIVDPGSADVNGFAVGRIGRLATSLLIEDGDTIKVSYTHATWASLTFPVATANYIQGAARIDYLTLKGTQWRRHIPKCQLKPDGAMNFDSKNILVAPLSLVVLDDYANNPTKPYGWVEIL